MSHELLNVVKSLSRAHTRSRITLYKSELQRKRKVSLKMEDYLNKMKVLANNLLLASSPISTSNLITQTLIGLDNEYNRIVVQLLGKVDLTWIDLQATLLTYENRLEKINALTNSMQFQSNLANKTNNSEARNNWKAI